MRKTKVYRPRRGMRFAYGKRGGPTVGFIGSGAITRTRPTKLKVNFSTKTTDTLSMSGSVMTTVLTVPGAYPDPTDPTVMASSFVLEGAVSTGRVYEKRKYNATLLGLPVTNVDKAPWPSLAVVDAGITPGVLTGTFVSPSWTRASIGTNQAFVATPYSSSIPEVRSLNYFYSGTQAIETSAVPASASLFYGKKQRLQTIVVKHTASFFDTIVQTSGATVPSTYQAGLGALCAQTTGVAVTGTVNHINNPATIFMSVPVTGRLVDIKVWVEVIHLSGGAGRQQPLNLFGISLVSPNVTWGHAHPIYNDPLFRSTVQIDGYPCPLPTFYKDSFILWEGAGIGPFAAAALGLASGDAKGGYNLAKYPCWGKDRGMRTVFADSAPTPNPRHLYNPTSPSGNYLGAPNAYQGSSSTGIDGLSINSAFGCNVPWTSDATITPDPGTYQQSGSPPQGWLNGVGGANDVNEWPTTGFNYGAPYVRPLYPLLDPIFIKKVLGDERGYNGGQIVVAPPQPDLWRGFRPGLRGTEISGTWKLHLVNNTLGNATTDVADMYFRQVRLEITYETPNWSGPGRLRAHTSHPPRRADAEQFLFAISGTDNSNVGTGAGTNYDYFRNLVFTRNPSDAEIGRTLGLVMNSGSIGQATNYALLYRLTGTLAGISGSAPGWLTNNFSQMPSIPQSSASLSPPMTASLDGSTVLAESYIYPRKSLDGARRLKDVVQDINPPRPLVQLAADFVSGSNT